MVHVSWCVHGTHRHPHKSHHKPHNIVTPRRSLSLRTVMQSRKLRTRSALGSMLSCLVAQWCRASVPTLYCLACASLCWAHTSGCGPRSRTRRHLYTTQSMIHGTSACLLQKTQIFRTLQHMMTHMALELCWLSKHSPLWSMWCSVPDQMS